MAEDAIRILLITENEERVQEVENFCLKEAEVHCELDISSFRITAEEVFLNYTPSIILLDLSKLAIDEADAIMSKLERVSVTLPIIGLFENNQKEMAYEFIKKGLQGVLDLPLKPNELNQTLYRHQKHAPKSSDRHAQIFTFFSFKGGVGNTFVTLNAAIKMAKMTKKKVLLWDMDLQAGDIPFYLDYKPDYTIADILENIDLMDESYLNGVLMPHETGISMLACPDRIEDVDKLSAAKMEKILGMLSQNYDYIFIDGGYRLTDALIPLIDLSTYLFITTTLELIALRSAARCLDILERIQVPAERIKIIINRYLSKKESIKIEQAKEILKLNFAQLIGNDYNIATQSVNLGKPVCEIAKKSALDKHFEALVIKLQNNFKDVEQTKTSVRRIQAAVKKVLKNVSSR